MQAVKHKPLAELRIPQKAAEMLEFLPSALMVWYSDGRYNFSSHSTSFTALASISFVHLCKHKLLYLISTVSVFYLLFIT